MLDSHLRLIRNHWTGDYNHQPSPHSKSAAQKHPEHADSAVSAPCVLDKTNSQGADTLKHYLSKTPHRALF